MTKSKKQIYENYWSITLAYTDLNSKKFIETLRAIVNFIDSHNTLKFDSRMYQDLQEEVGEVNGLSGTSLRKSINQFVKLGFINYKLHSYHKDCKIFLEARACRKRRTIFSKIVYENSSFNRDITKDSQEREVNFLLKTLEEVGQLRKEDIAALMTQKISEYPKGYLTEEELEDAKQNANEIKFYERKYNQVSHLRTVLSKLDDLVMVSGTIYFEEDAKVAFGEDFKAQLRVRDNYLHRLYKNQLKEESEEREGEIMCMVELLDYPSLVASHIKPFIKSNDEEAYDPENGLLLSRNMDVLFDQGYISFTDEGKIILSKELSEDLKEFLKDYGLKKIYLTKKRLKFLKFHRQRVFKKNNFT